MTRTSSQSGTTPASARTAGSTSLTLLRQAHESLLSSVGSLATEELTAPSRAEGWSVAQVLSHLGSAAEICTVLVRRGIEGDLRGPDREWLLPIWERWDARPPVDQAAAWQEAEREHLALLEGMTDTQRRDVRIPYFIGPLAVEEYIGYRLSEAVVHAWDVQAAVDPDARLLAAAVPTLLARIDLVASRFRDGAVLASLSTTQLAVHLAEPQLQEHCLSIGEELHLWPCSGKTPDGTIRTDGEALLRLVYGRHPQALDVTGPVSADQLRALFPGF